MTPRHRLQPAKSGGPVKRAVVTAVLSALALTSVTITAAAVTLTNAEPQPDPPVAAAPPTATTTTADGGTTLAPPVEVAEVPIGIRDIALVKADGPLLADIPSQAVGAYQRAEAVLARADKSCHLDWTLIAAVGQVVSGHGSTAGSELAANGAMRPRYTGKPLTDDRDRRVPDSDAGRLDGDQRFDRPIGPMQLSPATWAVVGVDGDGDGKRNPNDVDDAALSVSVLLCSGDEDLRKRADRVSGVRRINNDRSFIETVLAVDRGYQAQESAALDVDPVVVPSQAPPVYVRTAGPTDPSTDLPTVPDPSSSFVAVDPVTWSPPPTPTPDPTVTPTPTPTPTDTPDACPTDETQAAEEPTDLPTATEPLEPVDTAETDPTDPSDSPTDAPTTAPTDVPTDPVCDDD